MIGHFRGKNRAIRKPVVPLCPLAGKFLGNTDIRCIIRVLTSMGRILRERVCMK